MVDARIGKSWCGVFACRVLMVHLIGSICAAPLAGQSFDDSQEQVIERFFEVLIRRPRPGTALDRVYNHHVQNRTLDEFIASLEQRDSPERAGQRQMVLGLVQLRRGQFPRAVEALRTAERSLDNDAMASYHLGVALLALGKTDEAAAALQRSIDRQPSRREAPDVYLQLGRLQVQAGKPKQAVRTWKALQSQFPGDRGIAERIAQTLAEEKQYAAALQQYVDLAKRVDAPEQKVQYQIASAQLLRKLDRPDEATRQLHSLLMRLRPDSWLYQNVRDRLEAGFLADDSIDALMEFYSEGIKQRPDDLAMRLRLGQMQALAGRWGPAQQTLEQALRLAPDDIAMRVALIDVLVRSGQPSRTTVHFRHLNRLDPGNPDHTLRWGRVILMDSERNLVDRRQSAAAIWRRLLDTRADDPVMHVRVAKLLTSIDQSEEASALYRKAIELAPDAPQYREYLGEFLHRRGRVSEAIETWRSMAEGPRRTRRSLVRLAEVLASFEHQEQSLAAWRAAAEFDLSFDEQLRYARALRSAQAYTQAIEQLESAEQLAQTREERQRVRRDQVTVYSQSGRLREKLVQLAREQPTAQNRRFAARLHRENRNLAAAALDIQEAISMRPDDIESLEIAADIAEQQQRFSDAIQRYRRLIELDDRYRTNHLRRIIALQQSSGNLAGALQSATDLIAATPSEPTAYTIYATIAFELGKEDAGVAALRTAIDYAPRDNLNRWMLAKRKAASFATAEAIDLYWEAMRYESDWNAWRKLIEAMAPLYRRRGETDQFLIRLERFASGIADHAQAQRMVATYWQTTGDYRRASFILRQLQSQHADDPALLRQLVACLIAASEDAAATAFQSQLVDLTGEFEDVQLLTQLELKAGVLEPFGVFERELAATVDPARVVSILQRAATENPARTAELCRYAIKRDPTLWAVKCILIQLRMMYPGEDPAATYAETDRLAEEILSLDLNAAARPPTFTRAQTTKNAIAPQTSDSYTISLGRTFAPKSRQKHETYAVPKSGFIPFLRRLLGTADVASDSLSAQRGSTWFLIPEDYHQARWLSCGIRVISRCRRNKIAQNRQSVHEVIQELFPMPTPDQIDDPNQLKQLLSFHELERALSIARIPDPEAILWRMAELDPLGDLSQWRNWLSARMTGSASRRTNFPGVPLDKEKLRILEKVVLARQQRLFSVPITTNQLNGELLLRKLLRREFALAGKEPPKLALESEPNRSIGFVQTLAIIQVALWENEIAIADRQISQLADLARNDNQTDILNDLLDESAITWLFRPEGKREQEFVRRHRQRLPDIWLAHCARRIAVTHQSLTAERMVNRYGEGQVQLLIRLQTPWNRGSVELQPQSTLSKHLIDEYLLRGLLQLATHFHAHGSIASPIPLPEECVNGLRLQVAGATENERQLRRLVVAFSAFWDQRPRECYRQILTLCRESPDDIALQVEAARFELEFNEVDKAFDRLRRIETPNERSVIEVELARIYLCALIGVREPTREAAEKILALNLDPPTRSAMQSLFQSMGVPYEVSQKLARLNFVPQGTVPQGTVPQGTVPQGTSVVRSTSVNGPAVVFQPTHVFRGDDLSQLRTASVLLAMGNRMTASEIAFSVLQSSIQNNQMPPALVRKRAVNLLRRADRLDPLIASIELQVKSTPNNQAFLRVLAELYQLNGQSEKAASIWEEAITAKELTPEQIVVEADSLHRKRKPDQAAIAYLMAFRQQPALWKTHWTAFVQAGEEAGDSKALYLRLQTLDVRSFSLFSLCNVIGIHPGDAFSPPQRAFVRRVIDTHPDALGKSAVLKRFIPESERKHFRELFE